MAIEAVAHESNPAVRNVWLSKLRSRGEGLLMKAPKMATLLLAMGSASAGASDWKYVDPLTMDSRDFLQFYDSASVSRDGPLLRVWIRWISFDDYAAFAGTLPAREEITREAEARVQGGYRPPRLSAPGYELMHMKKGESEASVAARFSVMEAFANRGAKSTLNSLYEIDCKGKLIRVLASTETQSSNRASSNQVKSAGDWRHVIPDSMADILSQILCK